MTSKKQSGLVTHDGPFHADEIVACAQLVYAGLVKKGEIHRSRDPQIINTYHFVVDVGGIYDETDCAFDHHQGSYQGELSSAGMIGRYLLHTGVYDKNLYQFLCRSLLDHVDAFDNGRVSKEVLNTPTFGAVVENFVPIQEDTTRAQMDQAFFEAFDFVYGYFERLIKRYQYRQKAKDTVARVMQVSKEILVFDEMLPWLENFFELGGIHHPGLYIVMPVPNGWKLRVIPKTYEERMGARRDLPAHWGGLTDEEFVHVSGIEGAKFCHKGLFIAIFSTKEGAIQAAKKSLEQT